MPSGLSLHIQVKNAFFDRRAVISRLDKVERQNLSKAGAFIRTRARSSIRKRKRVSAVGSPPSSHVGTLKRLIYFSYDQHRHSVVIGPVPYGQGDGGRVLEHGGVARLTVHDHGQPKAVRAVVGARPFMGPALAAEEGSTAGLWRNSVRE